MTKEEILAMKAGRDLNLLVCEKVFDNKTFGSVKPYSTDISAAWQVWERTKFDAVWRIINPDGIQYCAGYVRGEDNDLICYSKDLDLERCLSPICGSFPEAICKAALLVR